MPSRRPTIDEILSSQWINHQNITLESALVSTKSTKKMHWFSRNRVLNKHSDSSQDRSIDINLLQLYFNTKRANSVLEENFLHPIAVPIPDEINNMPENHVKAHRKSIFGSSLKKKIGPMEEKTKGNLFNRNSIDEKTSSISIEQIQALRKTVESSSKKNSIPNAETAVLDEEEQGEFLMSPAPIDDLTNVHPLDAETRRILNKLGITSEMLFNATESGPRSDIIGAYRIVIHRLQRQQQLTKQNDLFPADPEPIKKPKHNNNNRTCAIL